MSCFLSNLVSGSVRPLMYGRVAKWRVNTFAKHSDKFFRCRDWWWETPLLCNLGNEVCRVAIGFQSGVNMFNFLISPCFRIG